MSACVLVARIERPAFLPRLSILINHRCKPGLKAVIGAFGLAALGLLLGPSGPANAQCTVAGTTTACGTGATATGANATAYGANTFATGNNSTAVGFVATAQGDNSIGIGLQPTMNRGAFGTGSIAIGTNPAAGNGFDINGRGQNAIAIGTSSFANFGFGANGVAVGAGTSVNGNNATAVGPNNNVSGNNSGAFGTSQTVNGNGSFGFGDPNTINGNGTFVTGNNNTVNGPNVAGNGDNIQVVGSNNTLANTASASGASVFGTGNAVNSVNALVMGNANTVTGANGIAIGNGNSVAGANAVALGNGASANFDNSAAFGNGATVTRANQQVFGTVSNTYTMAGITSGASRAAQSGPVQIVTSDAGGNLATSTAAGLGLATTADIAGVNSQLSTINGRLNDLDNKATKAFNGTAMAFAMAGVPALLPTERFAVSANWGTFQGTNGMALNAALRLTSHAQADGAVAYGANGGGVGGRLGLRFGW